VKEWAGQIFSGGRCWEFGAEFPAILFASAEIRQHFRTHYFFNIDKDR
jgi:hypothetical protein